MPVVMDSGAEIILDSGFPGEGESGEDGIYLTYEELREYAENYQYTDAETGLTADQAIIALYKEYHFTLYGLFPLVIAVLIFVAGCKWFSSTFIPWK